MSDHHFKVLGLDHVEARAAHSLKSSSAHLGAIGIAHRLQEFVAVRKLRGDWLRELGRALR